MAREKASGYDVISDMLNRQGSSNLNRVTNTASILDFFLQNRIDDMA